MEKLMKNGKFVEATVVADKIIRKAHCKIIGVFLLLTSTTLINQAVSAKDEPEKKVPFKDVQAQLEKHRADLMDWSNKFKDDYTSATAPSYENDSDPEHTRRVFAEWSAKVQDSWRTSGGSENIPEGFELRLRGDLSMYDAKIIRG